jgi:DNA replication protein DnaD
MANELQKTDEILPRRSGDLTQQEQVKIVFDFFTGKDKKELAKEYNIEQRSITSLIDKYRCHTTKETAFKIFEIQKARENEQISNIKERIYNLLAESLEDMIGQENKAGVVQEFTKIKDILGKIDEISRLNNNEATQSIKTDTTTRTIDINKILSELPTQEDRLAFLQKRAEYDRGIENN